MKKTKQNKTICFLALTNYSQMFSATDGYHGKGNHPGGGPLGISGWGCAAGTLEPLTYTVEPRFNEPLYNEDLDITNHFLYPNNSKIYEK